MSSRREKFGHKKEGTGRSAKARPFEIRGARTGWQPPADVRKDAEGFDDLVEFFDEQQENEAANEDAAGGAGAAAASALPTKKINFDNVPSAAKQKPAAAAAHSAADERPQYDANDYGEQRDDDDDGSAAAAAPSEPARVASSRSGVAGAGIRRGAAARPQRAAAAAASDEGEAQFGYTQDQAEYAAGDSDGDGPVAAPARRPATGGRGRGGAVGGGGGRGGGRGATAAARKPAPVVEEEDAGEASGGEEEEQEEGPRARAAGDDDHDDGFTRRKHKPAAAARAKAKAARGGDGAGKAAHSSVPKGKKTTFAESAKDRDAAGASRLAGYSRGRPSLGVGFHGGELLIEEEEGGGGGGGLRASKRRRWKPLAHYKGERVLYQDAVGAVAASKLGVASPVLAGLSRAQRSRSESARGRARERSRSKASASRGAAGAPGGSSRHGGRVGSKDARSGSARRGDLSDGEDDKDAGGRRGRAQAAAKRPRHEAVPGGGSEGEEEEEGDGGAGRGGRRAKADAAKLREENASLRKELSRCVTMGDGTRLQQQLAVGFLPPGYAESASSNLVVNPGNGHPMYQIAVVRQFCHMTFESLPVTGQRPPHLQKAVRAAAAFDAPQFISGTLHLLPHAMKDEENTQSCTQVFVVVRCQPRAVEVVIADQRYLLSQGDHFFVPQGTTYSLANYSPKTEAEVSFLVLKPAEAEPAPAIGAAPTSPTGAT